MKKIILISSLLLIMFLFTKVVFAEEDYKFLMKFEGSGDKTTETFTIDSNKWRINWSVVPANEYKTMYVYVHKEGQDFSVANFSMGENNSDSYVVREGPGKFYLEVNAANLKSWTLNIEQGPKVSAEEQKKLKVKKMTVVLLQQQYTAMIKMKNLMF